MKPRHFWIALGTFVLVAAGFWYTTVGWAWLYGFTHPLPDKSSAELLKEATEANHRALMQEKQAKDRKAKQDTPKKRAAQGTAHEN